MICFNRSYGFFCSIGYAVSSLSLIAMVAETCLDVCHIYTFAFILDVTVGNTGIYFILFFVDIYL